MFVIIPSPIPELQHAPLSLKVLQAKERASTLCFFVVSTSNSHLESIKKLGGVSIFILKLIQM